MGFVDIIWIRLKKGKKRQKRIWWYCFSLLGLCNPLLNIEMHTVLFAVFGTHSPGPHSVTYLICCFNHCSSCLFLLFLFCQRGVQENGSQKQRNAQWCISMLTADYINLTSKNSTTRFFLAFFFAFFQPNPRGRRPRDHLFSNL